MHIAILGAGAMGSWFGGQLALQGHDVQLLSTNAEHIRAVCDNGLVMHTHGDEDHEESTTTVNVRASMPDQYNGTAELVIVLTKSYQTHAAMREIAPQLNEKTAVLSLQNGLGNVDAIAAFVHPSNIWLGMTMMPVDRLGPGIVASRGVGQTSFGHLDATHHELGDQIADAFAGTGMEVRHEPDVQRRIWEKVAFNAGMNAICALTCGSPGTVGQLPEATELARSVAREVADVANVEGLPISLDTVFSTIAYACEYHGGHKPSMVQDLLSGKRTEVEAINGAIVELGRKHGLETPLNSTLATLIRLAELGYQVQSG